MIVAESDFRPNLLMLHFAPCVWLTVDISLSFVSCCWRVPSGFFFPPCHNCPPTASSVRVFYFILFFSFFFPSLPSLRPTHDKNVEMKISIQQQQQHTAVKSVEISNPRKICTFEEEERKTVQSLKIVRCLRVVLLDHLPVNHLHPFGPSSPSN